MDKSHAIYFGIFVDAYSLIITSRNMQNIDDCLAPSFNSASISHK